MIAVWLRKEVEFKRQVTGRADKPHRLTQRVTIKQKSMYSGNNQTFGNPANEKEIFR